MFDAYSRSINYLRISVTDRCNLRCNYCVPAEGAALCRKSDLLRFEEIEAVVAYGVKNGIRKVRLTGGEPLVRKDIVSLVEMLARIEGLHELNMTTNGQLLPQYASQLKRAGLTRLNISLDTMDAETYSEITRGGRLNAVLEGIDVAKKAGFDDIRINCVVSNSADEPDAMAVNAFGRKEGLTVRFIRKMTTENGEFWDVIGGEGGNCARCNRLRLSSQGDLFPCLFNDIRFSVRQLGIASAFKQALQHKPECGYRSSHHFYQIGG